jgi:triosephosphate isomerase (TIM)
MLSMLEVERPAVIVGNWKMYKTIAEAKIFIKGLMPVLKDISSQVGLAVPFTMITTAVQEAQSSPLAIGAQNIWDADEGAFTGEVSCRMVKDAGAAFVIVGHSERRRLFNESDALVNRKLKSALNLQLRAIVCVGETLEQYQQGKTNEVLQRQMRESLHGITAAQSTQVILAYEPVWAIGTGQTATPEGAQKVHQFCRKIAADLLGKEAASKLVIQYGGSVKPDNAAALLNQPDIDGLLVGGASLALESFIEIVRSPSRSFK